jgi:hypothetical protein
MATEDNETAKAESPTQPELDPRGPEVAVMERRQAILGVLNQPELQNPHFPSVLRDGWVRDLGENLSRDIPRAQEAGKTKVGIVQHAEAHLGVPEQAAFVDAFLAAFDARAHPEGGPTTRVRSDNIGDLMANPRFPRLPQPYEWSAGYSGHVTVDDSDQPTSVMFDTKLEGVKLVFDGRAVTGGGDELRAMLAISLRGRPEGQAA